MGFLPVNPALPEAIPARADDYAGAKPANTGEYVPVNRPRAQNRSGGHGARITPATSRVREAVVVAMGLVDLPARVLGSLPADGPSRISERLRATAIWTAAGCSPQMVAMPSRRSPNRG